MAKATDTTNASGVPPLEHHSYTSWVTPELAARWLEERNLLAYQRAIRAPHVKFLAETMRRGEFDTSSPIHFGFIKDQGRQLLLDGQHRLRAIEASGIPQALVVVETLLPDLESARRLYSRKDRGLGRSLRDAFRALDTMPEGIGLRHAEWIGRAALQIGRFETGGGLTSGDYEARSAEHRAALIAAWAEPARAYLAAIEGGIEYLIQLLSRAQVMGVALVTFRDTPARTRAAEFWNAVALNDGLRKGDARHELVRQLLDNKAGPTLRLAHITAICWNRWWKRDDEVQKMRLPKLSSKVSIAGTSFNFGTDGLHPHAAKGQTKNVGIAGYPDIKTADREPVLDLGDGTSKPETPSAGDRS